MLRPMLANDDLQEDQFLKYRQKCCRCQFVAEVNLIFHKDLILIRNLIILSEFRMMQYRDHRKESHHLNYIFIFCMHLNRM